MIREFSIKNYKSIVDHTIELGRINVFIGENGSGKTNILEALAMSAAALTGKLSVEDLFNRGMRVARPATMRSSFPGRQAQNVLFTLRFEAPELKPVEVPALSGINFNSIRVWVLSSPDPVKVSSVDPKVGSASDVNTVLSEAPKLPQLTSTAAHANLPNPSCYYISVPDSTQNIK